MERDYGKEIDALCREQGALKQQIQMLIQAYMAHSEKEKPFNNAYPNNAEDDVPTSSGHNKFYPIRNMHPDPRFSELMLELCQTADEGETTGLISYMGVFSSGGRQSNWIQKAVDTNILLALIEERKAEKVLACIGSNDRLNILLTLLREPMTVAGLVEHCGYNSTGQVYHHLKPLIAADIVSEVEQGERGVYAVKFHRVQGIIMLLAGIADLLDPKYSQGQYTPEP